MLGRDREESTQRTRDGDGDRGEEGGLRGKDDGAVPTEGEGEERKGMAPVDPAVCRLDQSTPGTQRQPGGSGQPHDRLHTARKTASEPCRRALFDGRG